MATIIFKMVCVVMMCIAFLGSPKVKAGITCGQVAGTLSPCIAYLVKGGTPSASCCNGVKGLNAAARTPADRQTACKCMKNAAGTIRGINLGNAVSLAEKCGVNIPYKISPSTNCASIKF